MKKNYLSRIGMATALGTVVATNSGCAPFTLFCITKTIEGVAHDKRERDREARMNLEIQRQVAQQIKGQNNNRNSGYDENLYRNQDQTDARWIPRSNNQNANNQVTPNRPMPRYVIPHYYKFSEKQTK
ncbi:MAG: hypothetical protein Q7S74_01580 [Nanoarchaeota archaeon]|nr:hypothetical protein [Nanoarchaeota archaeon]